MSGGSVVGLVLAAGAGSRYGQPKALVTEESGRPWVRRATEVVRAAGVSPVYVVVGAAADQVRDLLDPIDIAVEAVGWAEGMGASLRAGLAQVAADQPDADAVLIMLVDLPGVGADVVRRLVESSGPTVLARASYDAVPGHPVLIGRQHWAGVIASAHGDSGARDYLAQHPTDLVECADIGSGLDVDRP